MEALSAPPNRGDTEVLRPGDQVPHVTFARSDGSAVAYATLWQQRNLLLVALPSISSGEAAAYVRAIEARHAELTAYETAVVITQAAPAWMPVPGILIADRWGEIQQVTAAPTIADLPDVDELIASLRFVQVHCPECQGETR